MSSETSPDRAKKWQALVKQSSEKKWKFGEQKMAGVEYSVQKLDQLRARMRLMLAQHLIASKFYIQRYYMLCFPAIAMSSFLTVTR